MDTISSLRFLRAFLAHIARIHRLFQKEPNAFNYGKKGFLALLFAVFLIFGGITKTAEAASWQDYMKGLLFSLPTQSENNQAPAPSSAGENLSIVQGSAVISYAGPNLEQNDQPLDLFAVYTVKEGDSLAKIAANYGLSLNTVLWANNLTVLSVIQPGDELKILPVDGILYTVKKGDVLSVIAKRYKSDIEQIIEFNDLPADGFIKEGDELLLPGGEMPQAAAKAVPKNNAKSVGSVIRKSLKEIWQEVNELFIVPVSGIITQLRHGQNGVDVGNSCGTPVFAARNGTVTIVQETNSRSRGAFGGYGNNIRIAHLDGTLTLYAHLFAGSILVQPGQEVKQGQQIAQIGGGWDWLKKGRVRMEGAGRSTGCHLHFETRGPWGTRNVLSQYRRGALVNTPAAVVAIDPSSAGSGDVSDDASEHENQQ